MFGAGRPGNRAVECRNGHCGVDLGGEIWASTSAPSTTASSTTFSAAPTPSAADGSCASSHRNGTVITQYFHLAAIPRWLERGVHVKGGDVVGLLGDSGVHESAPHLHFSISIRQSPAGPRSTWIRSR